MKKRRMIETAVVCALAAALVSGCGSSSGSENKLTFWTNLDSEVETLQAYADEWGEENGFEVEIIQQSPSVQQFAQAVKSEDGPDGVIGIPNDQLADFVNAGLTAEVPSDLYDDADFVDAAVQGCYVDGVRYAAPLSVETIALYYNTDMVSEVPETWEELVEHAADDGGLQFDAASIYYDLGFVRACGGYVFNYSNGSYDVTDIGLANAGAVEAYEFIYDLKEVYGLVSADVTADIARSNFQNGEIAYYIGGPWDASGFESAGTSFAISELPTYNGEKFIAPVGTQICFVSNDRDNQEETWDFIMYLIDNAALDLFDVGYRLPAKAADQELEEIQSDAYAKVFMAQSTYGEPLPTVSEMGQVWTIYSNNIESMWLGELTAQEAADNMLSQIEEAIELLESGK